MHLDAHIVDHVDDVFDLFRIDDVIGQVIIDLGVGQVTLFFATGNQQLQLGLLCFFDFGSAVVVDFIFL